LNPLGLWATRYLSRPLILVANVTSLRPLRVVLRILPIETLQGTQTTSRNRNATRMSANKSDLLRGTLDLLILKVLTLEPLHGLGISRRLEQITGGVFQVQAGTLFPALHRLEQKGYIQGEWRESENNRRAKYYGLTEEGLAQLGEEHQNWVQVVAAINAVLVTV
jgi:PadR family transcriptional regulator, regulatory protein PadR